MISPQSAAAKTHCRHANQIGQQSSWENRRLAVTWQQIPKISPNQNNELRSGDRKTKIPLVIVKEEISPDTHSAQKVPKHKT